MMKKTLIALAALAATSAFAQSSVSIVGFVDAGYKNTTSDIAANKKSEIAVNGTGTTAIHFRGVEDLGGGLKALFQAEIDWNPAQSTTLNSPLTGNSTQFYNGTPFNGEQFIGLSGGFGSVKLGTPNAAALETNAVAQPFGTALGGGYTNSVGRLGVNGYGINQYVGGISAGNRVIRHEKTVRYDTPDLSGFGASVEYAFGNANASAANNATAATYANSAAAAGVTVAALPSNNTNKYLALGLKYSNGPLNVMFSNTKATADGTTPANGSVGTVLGGLTPNKLLANESITHNFLAANYTFGAATVYGGYTTSKNNAASTLTGNVKEDATSYNIAGKYAVSSQIALMANYVRVKDRNQINNGSTIIGLGANYSLSNRTYMYARYEGYKKNATTAILGNTYSGVGSVKQNVYMLGVAHSF